MLKNLLFLAALFSISFAFFAKTPLHAVKKVSNASPFKFFPTSFSFQQKGYKQFSFEKDYRLATLLNFEFKLALERPPSEDHEFPLHRRQNAAPLSLLKNWYLPTQNWGLLAQYQGLEIAQAKEKMGSFLIGMFRPMKENSKIGVGYHYTDLSDNYTDIETQSRGLFINYIVEY